MTSPNDIQFTEGVLHTVEITIPDAFSLSGKKAKVQVRRDPKSPAILEFSTGDPDGNFVISGQKIDWVIPGYMSIEKDGRWKWQLIIWTDEINPAASDTFSFIIDPATAKLG